MSKVTTLPTLYKYTQKNQVQQWTINIKDDYFWTEEGIQGGTITTSKPTYCKAKNVGRSNATTPPEQALSEAKAKWQKKVDGGYNEVLTKEKKFLEPMLAHELSKYKKLLFTVPTYIQPKLDGLRAISEDNRLTSRNGKPYLATPHLYQSDYVVDGELYNHKYHDDFNKIVSLCKKQSPTNEEIAEAALKVQFWAYDLPEVNDVYVKRWEALAQVVKNLNTKAGADVYRLIPMHEVKNMEEVEKWHERYLELGYEGSMLRLDLGPYENKRSKQLLKKKDFIDEEFKIIGAEEGEGGRAGTIGYFIVELEDGKTCKSNVKGDFDYLAEVWKDKEKYIGTKATIKYFNRTPEGSLRFPYVIKLNREAYE
jgi:DNA ligase-1